MPPTSTEIAARMGAETPIAPVARRTRSGGMASHLQRAPFRGLAVRVGTVEADPFCATVTAYLGADHVPAFAEMKHSVMELGRPAPRRDPHAFDLGHQSESTIRRSKLDHDLSR